MNELPIPPELPSPADLSGEEHPVNDLSDGLMQDWHRLAVQSGSGAFFASPGFVTNFAEVFGDRVRVSILTLRSPDGTLQGLLPLMRAKVSRAPSLNTRYVYQTSDFDFIRDAPRRISVPVAQLSTPLGLEATSLRSEILCRPEMRATVLRALPRALARLGGWNVAVLVVDENDAVTLAAGGLWAARYELNRELKFLRDVRPASALIELQSKKFRQNARRTEKFAQEAGAEFETLRGADAVSLAMDEFADLAGRSWKVANSGGRSEKEDVFVPYNSRQRRFFERLMMSGEGEPVLIAARMDGRMASAILMLVHHNRLLTLLTFSEADLGRLGLGRLVLQAAIDFAAAEKLVEIDYNSNAVWTVPYSDSVSMRSNVLMTAPTFGGRWRSCLAAGWRAARRID